MVIWNIWLGFNSEIYKVFVFDNYIIDWKDFSHGSIIFLCFSC